MDEKLFKENIELKNKVAFLMEWSDDQRNSIQSLSRLLVNEQTELAKYKKALDIACEVLGERCICDKIQNNQDCVECKRVKYLQKAIGEVD